MEVTDVSDRLHTAAKLFESRDAEYGSSFKNFGNILHQYLGTMTIGDAETWGRLAVFILLLGKLDRYGRNFLKGGHGDSLNDLSVYAQMLAFLDDKGREG